MILQRHLAGRVHWLPNPAVPVPVPTAARLRFARRWLCSQLMSAAPVWLIPSRLLRRKNIAEALLLTRWLRPEACRVTTGGASSADERAYAEKLACAARAHGWPLRLGILAGGGRNKPAVQELMAASEAVLSTSIQEGFGMTHIESAAAGRPLIARRLPNVASDLAMFGFRFPQSYDEILVAPCLFDWPAEVRRQASLFRAWLRRLPRTCRKWAGEPLLIACRNTLKPVPFSRLTLTAQLEALGRPSAESWELCAPLNPFLRTWRKRSAAGCLRVTSWPRDASRLMGGEAYAARFEEIVRATPCPGNVAASLAAQEAFIRARIDASHQFPLLWSPES